MRRTFVPQKCSGLSAAVLVGEPAVEISPCVVLYHGSLHLGRSISGCGGARGKFAALCAGKIFYEEQQQNGIHCGWCVLCSAGCLCSLQNDTRGMQKAGIQGTAGTISHNGGTFAVRAEPWASLCGADGCVVWAVPDRIASTHVGVYKLPAQTGCDNPMVGSGGGPPICFAAADK